MLKVGITGGIGSGKTTVCTLFGLLGVPVFYADAVARVLMESDTELIAGISALFGAGIYESGRLDRPAVSAAVFHDPKKLEALSTLVHPATVRESGRWFAAQSRPYAIKEAALFFESGTYREMDIMIGISAPAERRIARVMARSAMTREDVISRIDSQMDDAEKMLRCDYVIVNDGIAAIIPQVLKLDRILLEKAV